MSARHVNKGILPDPSFGDLAQPFGQVPGIQPRVLVAGLLRLIAIPSGAEIGCLVRP